MEGMITGYVMAVIVFIHLLNQFDGGGWEIWLLLVGNRKWDV